MTKKTGKNEMPETAPAAAKIINLLNAFSNRSKNSLSQELEYSRATIDKIYQGRNTSLFAYAGVIASLAYAADWKIEVGEVPEMVEHALKTGSSLVVGVYDEKTKRMDTFCPLMEKDL